MLKIADVVEYILANRKNKAFAGWTPLEITSAVAKAIAERTFLYDVNNYGKICGLSIGYKSGTTIHITGILTTERESFKRLVQGFIRLYPDHTLSALRRDRFHTYNTKKFLQKVLA